MEVAKCFGLLPSSSSNIIFTKDKRNKAGMKYRVQAEKKKRM
jgi:hypothetical protein